MITLYGSSDDLVELRGDIEEEFTPVYEEPAFVGFSDGTLVRIEYTGEWQIRVLHKPAGTIMELLQAGDQHINVEEYNDYTDVLTIHSVMDWAVCGEYVR